MDIENTWRQESEEDNELRQLIDKANFEKLPSRLPLKKLRTNLLYGMIWAVVITIFYIVIFVFIPIWQVYVSLGILIVFNLLILFDSWKLYKRIPSTVTPSNSLKEELLFHYNSFQRWWSLQQRVSLFLYPIAITGGFILGGTLGSEKPVEDFLYNGKILGILGLTLLIVVPLCYFGAKWMFNYAYGRHLKKLKSSIDELNTPG